MRKELEQTERIIRLLADKFGLIGKITFGYDEDEEMLSIDECIYVRVEERPSYAIENRDIPFLIVEQAVRVPGGRWQPEDVDIVEVAEVLSPIHAAKAVIGLVIEANILEALEGLNPEYDKDDNIEEKP